MDTSSQRAREEIKKFSDELNFSIRLCAHRANWYKIYTGKKTSETSHAPECFIKCVTDGLKDYEIYKWQSAWISFGTLWAFKRQPNSGKLHNFHFGSRIWAKMRSEQISFDVLAIHFWWARFRSSDEFMSSLNLISIKERRESVFFRGR